MFKRLGYLALLPVLALSASVPAYAQSATNPIAGAITEITTSTNATLALGTITLVAFTIAGYIQSTRKRAR